MYIPMSWGLPASAFPTKVFPSLKNKKSSNKNNFKHLYVTEFVKMNVLSDKFLWFFK